MRKNEQPPTQKSASIAACVDGGNLTDCTDLCNRLKIALVLDGSRFVLEKVGCKVGLHKRKTPRNLRF